MASAMSSRFHNTLSYQGQRGAVRNYVCRQHVTRPSFKVMAYKVTFDLPKGKQVVEVDEKTSLLDAVRAAGIDVPSLCRTGACGTCASKVMSGEFEVFNNSRHVMSSEQEEAGYVLLCSTYPRSDLTILTHQEEEMYMTH